MNHYKVRITITSEKINNLSISQFFGKVDSCKTQGVNSLSFVVHEKGSKTHKDHYQAYIQSTLPIRSYRKSLRSFFKIKGNEEYSVSQCDKPELYCRYLCKGNSKSEACIVVHRNNDTINEVEEHSTYWSVNDEIQERKKKNKTFVSKILDELTHTGETINNPEQSVNYLLKYYVDNYRIIPHITTLRQQAITLLIHTSKPKESQKFKDHIKNNVLENFFSE